MYALVANNNRISKFSEVCKVDLVTHKVSALYSGFKSPHGLCISPDGTYALVANRASSTVSRIDLITHEVTFPFDGFDHPTAVSIAPDGTFAIVASFSDHIGRIDLVTSVVTFPYDVCNRSTGVAISPDGRYALATPDIKKSREWETDPSPHEGRNILCRIDLVTHEVTFPYAGFTSPGGVAISSDGTFALVVNVTGNGVDRIDGNIRAACNTGGRLQGKWHSEDVFRPRIYALWWGQWGDGFTRPHSLAHLADDVWQTPPALPNPPRRRHGTWRGGAPHPPTRWRALDPGSGVGCAARGKGGCVHGPGV
jgi:DNA-binding beta-propeller fold protein YncE